MAQPTGSLWPRLPAELESEILALLPPNEISCTARLVNKSAAKYCREAQRTTVRLSEPVPHHAFADQWRPGSPNWRNLSLKKRLSLLELTAASGVLENLQVAVEGAGCVLGPMSDGPLRAAAAAGHLRPCQWLHQQHGVPLQAALEGAAGSGKAEICEWALANGCECTQRAVESAARGGHPDLMFSLLARLPPLDLASFSASYLIRAAAEGCDLPTLQRLWHTLAATGQGSGEPSGPEGAAPAPAPAPAQPIPDVSARLNIVAAAAGSPTPDWLAKVEWLEATLGYVPQMSRVSEAAVARPDAVQRLAWLQERGYPLDEDTLTAAAGAGNVPAFQYLLGEEVGIELDEEDEEARPATEAARAGHVPMLRAMHAAGCPIEPYYALYAALDGGHSEVVRWLVEEAGIVGEEELGVSLVASRAAGTGDLELLVLLAERGCDFDGLDLLVAGGNEAALEWMLEQGCRMPDNGSPYTKAATNGDLATLRWLRRKGCPWGPQPSEWFRGCVGGYAPLATLRWLVEEGCPVDWGSALQAVGGRVVVDRGEIADWIRSEQEARRGLIKEGDGDAA